MVGVLAGRGRGPASPAGPGTLAGGGGGSRPRLPWDGRAGSCSDGQPAARLRPGCHWGRIPSLPVPPDPHPGAGTVAHRRLAR